MNDDLNYGVLSMLPNLSAADSAAATADNIATMLELIEDSAERNAIESSKLGDLMRQFRAISGDCSSDEVERLELEFIEVLRQQPALVHLHLGASYYEAVRPIRSHISAVEARQCAGTATAAEMAEIPELRRQVGELESEMRRHLDAFKTRT